MSSAIVCHMCDEPTVQFVNCLICQYTLCGERCLRLNPILPQEFKCPDCLSQVFTDCKNAVMRYRPPQVGVLILHLDEFQSHAWNMKNTIEVALRMGRISFTLRLDVIKDVYDGRSLLVEWFEALSGKATLMAFLVTETSERGWWIQGAGQQYDIPEDDMLQGLFTKDPVVYQKITTGVRQPLLFIVSCGSNFIKGRGGVECIDQWNKQSGCFSHIIAFVNSRLRAAEIHGFLAMFVQRAFTTPAPLHTAIIEAWCSDEKARTHSGLLWFTQARMPHALLLNSRTCPYGIPLPDLDTLCLCTCPGRWIKGRELKLPQGERFLKLYFTSSCCKLRLFIELETEAPRETHVSGVGCILAQWPGQPKHKFVLDRTKQIQRDKETQTVGPTTGAGQKRKCD